MEVRKPEHRVRPGGNAERDKPFLDYRLPGHWYRHNPDFMTREDVWAIQDEERRQARAARMRQWFQRFLKRLLFSRR